PTQRTRNGLVQAWENVNVRAGPGRQFRVLGRLAPGQIAPVIGKSADDLWWQITFEQRPGWVSINVVQFVGDGELVQVTWGEPPSTPTPAATLETTPTPESTSTPPVTATEIEETIGAPAP
ncbi:MAG: SH3 domain-containing protein, partial [Candidatus Roseilinea sp.]|uniref:SH3 domain-containing protein n=1 Tax=Candidatus Roseilinea sp. TaxID=2838777 RepID=UPI004049B694